MCGGLGGLARHAPKVNPLYARTQSGTVTLTNPPRYPIIHVLRNQGSPKISKTSKSQKVENPKKSKSQKNEIL